MLVWLYDLVVNAYFIVIKLAAIGGNEKARKWVKGRMQLWETLHQRITEKRKAEQKTVWMHCASLGEFEQGRPVIEAIKRLDPNYFIVLTFFSPSGYEIRKNYPLADFVCYLPQDSKHNAAKFINELKPSLALFVKYEFWWHYLVQLKSHQVPTLLISAIFRNDQPFFKWYGSLHRRMLGCFDKIFVQDQESLQLLLKMGFQQAMLAGDNRIDRVLEIAKNPLEMENVAAFCGDAAVLVCGSTWAPDEAILPAIFDNKAFISWKFILAPHDVSVERLSEIEAKLTVKSVRFSQLLKEESQNARLLLIDNIGKLSSLYQFGKIAYIGGGFGHGIHNTLEPAAYGLPVIFGPKHKKFEEANWFVKQGGGFVVENPQDLLGVFSKLQMDDFRANSAKMVHQFIKERSGATAIVMERAKEILDR